MSQTTYEPGVYVKGNQTRRANSAGEAVQAVWDGFVRAEDVKVDDVDYRDLQAQAKSLGLPANQSKADLQKAVAEHQVNVSADADTDTDN